MYKNLLILTSMILLLIGCKAGSGSGNETEIKGFKVVYHNQGKGTLPQIDDFVYFNLDIYDDKGAVIEKSRRDPNNMPIIQIIDESKTPDQSNPVIELMSSMAVGDSASMYIPIDSIPNPPPNMIGSEYIIYSVKTEKILDPEAYKIDEAAKRAELEAAAQAAIAEAPAKISFAETSLKDYLAGKKVGEIKEGPSGLKIIIIEDGSGPTANDGNMVSMQYAGYLKDMSTFDNSYQRGQPYDLVVGTGSVIEGWDKGIVYLKKGTKAIFDIPFAMAYGADGRPPTIPAKSDLLFFVELTDIK